MLNPIVGGTLVTVILLTPGRNRSSVSVISGDSALGLAPDDMDDLAGEVFLAIFKKDRVDDGNIVEVRLVSNNEAN